MPIRDVRVRAFFGARFALLFIDIQTRTQCSDDTYSDAQHSFGFRCFQDGMCIGVRAGLQYDAFLSRCKGWLTGAVQRRYTRIDQPNPSLLQDR
jgi:hypothetical protein